MAEGMAIPPHKRGRPRRDALSTGERDSGSPDIDILSISGRLGSQIGAKLRDARTAHGLTQQDLAHTTFSKSYISAIEHGKIKPSLRALVYLAERLELPISYFLDSPLNPSEPSVEVSAALQLAAAEHQASDQPLAALATLQELDNRSLTLEQRLRHLVLLAEVELTLKDGRAAQKAISEAGELAARLDDHESDYKLRQLDAEVEAMEGRPQIAVGRYQALVPAVQNGAIREPALRLAVYMGLGNALRKLGHYDEAATAFTAALPHTAEADNVDRLAATFWQLSMAWQQAGELERARDYASRSLALSNAATDICQVITIHTSLAEIAQHAGRWDEAQVHLEAALAVAEQLRNNHRCADALHDLARLVFKRNKITADLLRQADDYANRCLVVARKVGDDALIGKALAVVGLVREAEGDTAASDASYQQAIERLKQTQTRTALSETYYEYAQLLRKRGDAAHAGEYLQQAYLLQQG